MNNKGHFHDLELRYRNTAVLTEEGNPLFINNLYATGANTVRVNEDQDIPYEKLQPLPSRWWTSPLEVAPAYTSRRPARHYKIGTDNLNTRVFTVSREPSCLSLRGISVSFADFVQRYGYKPRGFHSCEVSRDGQSLYLPQYGRGYYKTAHVMEGGVFLNSLTPMMLENLPLDFLREKGESYV